MNRTRNIRLSIAALVAAVLLIVIVGLPGGASTSAEQNNLTRLPRPHPGSHLALRSTSLESDHITRSPRPHPNSHTEIFVYRP